MECRSRRSSVTSVEIQLLSEIYAVNATEDTHRRFIAEISNETAMALHELAARCTSADERNGGFTRHGALSIPSLLTMLAEDAAAVITRPGNWEGANTAQVFISHGYEV